MLSLELIEAYKRIGEELFELIENTNDNTDNLDVQAYYRVAERLYYDNRENPINCNKETELLINYCNVCGFNDDDYEETWYDLLPKFPNLFEKKYGMDYCSFAVKKLANYKNPKDLTEEEFYAMFGNKPITDPADRLI
jgi:hypothetical protein